MKSPKEEEPPESRMPAGLVALKPGERASGKREGAIVSSGAESVLPLLLGSVPLSISRSDGVHSHRGVRWRLGEIMYRNHRTL